MTIRGPFLPRPILPARGNPAPRCSAPRPASLLRRHCPALAPLLSQGIGDTIRVSLTDDPVREVEVGKEILRSLSLASRNVELIACPTCGRLEVDLFGIMKQLEEKLEGVKKPVKIAVLGCVVNGPGEASEADIGIAAGKGVAILYRKGKVIKRVKEEEIVATILDEVQRFQPQD